MNKVCHFYFLHFFIRYFLYGKKDFKYEGARNSDAFIKFMEDPKEESEQPAHAQEQQWKDTPSGVVHLGEDDFDDFLKSHPSLLVMFYAPCKCRFLLNVYFRCSMNEYSLFCTI